MSESLSRANNNVTYEEDAVDAAERIQHASTARKAVPKQVLVATIDGLSQYASSRGISPDVLEILVDALTKAPFHLDQGASGRIIKALIPRKKVSQEIVLKIVGCLGAGPNKPPLATQAGLLRWLVMVYNVLVDYTALSQLYAALFNLLDSLTLRGHLCHILSLITRRKHVKPFRIQALLQLSREVGRNEQPLNALLQAYKSYYPDIIHDIGPFKSSVFSHPNPEWMQKVLAIQEIDAVANPDQQQNSSFQIVRRIDGQASKRRKTERVALPEVYTFGAIESSVTLEEVRTADDFVKKLNKLELPNQLAAVLEDPLLQRLLALRPSATSQDRVNLWLAACLEDDFRASTLTPGAAARTGALLSKIVQYTRSTRRLPPPVEDYLKNYLRKWDGKSNIKQVLELASFLPARDFEQLHASYFKHIEKLARSGSDVSPADLLGLYSELLRNWTVTIGKKAPAKAPATKDLDAEAECVQKSVEHVGALCFRLFQDSSDPSTLGHALLGFYESVAALPWEDSNLQIILPPDSLVYYFLFVCDIVMFSRMCGIFFRYRNALMKSMDAGRIYTTEFVGHFNGFVMDICNCIWRNRAFTPTDITINNAHACIIPESVVASLRTVAAERGTELNGMFSLSHSPMMALFSANYIRSLEAQAEANGKVLGARHEGPVLAKARSLNALAANGGIKISYHDYRTGMLDYLRELGFSGLADFINSTISRSKTGSV